MNRTSLALGTAKLLGLPLLTAVSASLLHHSLKINTYFLWMLPSVKIYNIWLLQSRAGSLCCYGDCNNENTLYYFAGHPTNELSMGQVAGIVIGTLTAVGVFGYVCMQYEKMKKARQANSNQVRSRQPQSQTTDSFLETGAAAVEVAGPEPSDSQLLITDTGLEPPAPEQQPSFSQLIEPSAPTLSKTPPPSFEEAGKYPTLSLELEPPPPYSGLSVSEAELQQYPLNNPTYQSSNY